MEPDLKSNIPVEVSVIVLSYNHSATVRRALDSVLAMRAQCRALEIVVGDDGSTDGCYEICMEYADRFAGIVRVMPREPNMGVVRNYFRCLRTCKGRFVTDCAADDYRLPGTWLVKQLAMLNADSGLVAVGSDWIERRKSSDVYSRDCESHAAWRGTVAGRDMLEGVLASVGSFPVPLSTMLYRREAVNVDSNMVCNDAFGCEDMPLVCALGTKGSFGFVEEKSLLYSVGDDSLSNTRSEERLFGFYTAVLGCRLTLAEYYNAHTPDVDAAIEHGAVFVAGLAFDSGNKQSVEAVSNLMVKWGCKLPSLAKIKLKVTRYPWLWSLARGFKRIIGR